MPGFSPGVRNLQVKVALASARELGFLSGSDFSRDVWFITLSSVIRNGYVSGVMSSALRNGIPLAVRLD
jgi:hypothetical protein